MPYQAAGGEPVTYTGGSNTEERGCSKGQIWALIGWGLHHLSQYLGEIIELVEYAVKNQVA